MNTLVKTHNFEGPMELLLSLIEEKKLDITTVSLSEVTDQFLATVRDHNEINLSHLCEFLIVASKLVLIKSRALLPSLEIGEEEEQELEELQEQLEEYKRLKTVERSLIKFLQTRGQSISREQRIDRSSEFSPGELLSPQLLSDTFHSLVESLPEAEQLGREELEDVISVEEKIATIQLQLQENISTTFSSLIRSQNAPHEIVVTFMALLELMSQDVIRVSQESLHGEIAIMRGGSVD